MGVGIDHPLPTHRAPIPIGFAKHMMQWLIAAVGYGFRHALQVTARTLEQPVQIPARCVFYRTSPALKAMEIRREVRIEVLECRSDQRRYAIDVLKLTLSFATP